MNKTADLHIHTTASDGSYSVEEVFRQAARVGLSAISITDHDSVDSLSAAAEYASGGDIELIPGVELSVALDRGELHLLGYFINYRDDRLLTKLALLRKVRSERAGKILRKLEEIGISLDLDALLPGQMEGAVGRLHIAQALLRSGHVGSIPEAFARYVGDDGPAYVPKMKLTMEEAVEMIVGAGGLPVLAHPGQLKRDELIPELVEMGLEGLEVYYPSHSRFETNHYEEMARHYGLVATGGSDCHGPNKGKILMGTIKVPYEVVDRLKERLNRAPESAVS